jgi:hypothetical protein
MYLTHVHYVLYRHDRWRECVEQEGSTFDGGHRGGEGQR